MDAEALVGRVEELTAQLGTIGDPFAQASAEELIGALMELYGEGLERIVDAVAEDGSDALRARLVDDGVVASLLLIHGLYPVDLETRVREALDSVRPYMETHGGNVELLGIEDGVAQLRLEGSCHGCGASASTLELGIKQALEEAAPDLVGIEVEGVARSPRRASRCRWRGAGVVDERARAPAARAGGDRRRVDRRRRAGGREPRRRPARLPQRVRGVRRAAGGGAARGRDAELPRVRALVRAAARRPLDGGHRAAARARAAAARGRQACASRWPRDELRRPASRAGRRPAPLPAAPPAPVARRGRGAQCELCPLTIGSAHKHLLHLTERRILCVCGTCWAMRSGDAEFRPVGNRTVWLDDFALSDEQWAAFQLPIALAFLMISTVTGQRRRAVPEPGRGDRVRAGPGGVGGRVRARTRCWSSSPTSRR